MKKYFSEFILFSASLILFSALATPRVVNVKAQTTNLLTNGDFESGSASPWQNISSGNLSGTAYSGNYSARITTEEARQFWINVTPGRTYVYAAWFRWDSYTDSDWGYSTFSVSDDAWQRIAGINNLQNLYEQGLWHRVAVTFVPTTSQVLVNFGLFGPDSNVVMYFDDITLFEKVGNTAPVVNPTASVTSGSTPLSIDFTSNALDSDGGISHYRWQFGNGDESRSVNPTYTYRHPGSYNATITVWDNDGEIDIATIPIIVTGQNTVEVDITSPTIGETYTTNSSQLTLSGTSSTTSGSITSLSWDNIQARQSGIINSSGNWSADIPLKAGKNEILMTAFANGGDVGTDKLTVTRSIASPQVSNITVNTTSVPVYEKYEVTFDLNTTAEYPLFSYDTSTPTGVEPGIGVTAEGVITTPTSAVVTQPAFYFRDVERAGGYYQETNGQDKWRLRFSPQEEGVYQVSLRVTDASGTTTQPVGSFTATAPTRKGFIGVSPDDSRYFEFTNGNLYWPLGPAWGVTGTYAGINLDDTVLNYERIWMGGSNAYSTRWAVWWSSNQDWGNEGADYQLSYNNHYPGHELAQELFYPDGFRIWLPYWQDEEFSARFKSNTTYRVKARIKTVGVTGPRNSSYPYGFVVRPSGFLSHSTPDSIDAALRSSPIILGHVSGTNDWHTVVADYQTGSSPQNDLNVYLDNVTGGQAYIDELSIREVLGGGSLGAELVRQPRADLHTYVEERPMEHFEWQLDTAAGNDIYLRYVVQDKNDWIPGHLSANAGIFVENGNGYFQPTGTKTAWLQEQWWRYLAARLGYSTQLHSWELNNEGAPDDGTGSHSRKTQEFAYFLHNIDAHPHLASTSFWATWQPSFWGDQTNFPDVDYADIHHYGDINDLVQWHLDEATPVFNDSVGKPVIRGETGVISGTDTDNYHPDLTGSNSGVWYHNLLWAQLYPASLFESGYWFPQHMQVIPREQITRHFASFISDIPFNQGGYENAAATSSNSQVRVIGQKNNSIGRAHLWIQNSNHTFRNTSPASQSSTISINMESNTSYDLEWYDTYNGVATSTETITSDGSGNISFSVNNLTDDVAIKLTSQSAVPTPTPTITPTSTPTPEPACVADSNGNSSVEIGDINAVLFYWNQTCTGSEAACIADVNTNGTIEIGDISGILFYWGGICTN